MSSHRLSGFGRTDVVDGERGTGTAHCIEHAFFPLSSYIIFLRLRYNVFRWREKASGKRRKQEKECALFRLIKRILWSALSSPLPSRDLRRSGEKIKKDFFIGHSKRKRLKNYVKLYIIVMLFLWWHLFSFESVCAVTTKEESDIFLVLLCYFWWQGDLYIWLIRR